MSTDSKKSFLEDLYTDSDGFDPARAEHALRGVLNGIQRETHKVFFKTELKLKAEDQILAYALMKKVLKAAGAEEKSSVSGKEIKERTGLKAGTVDAAIKKLKDTDNLLLGSGSNYEIPAHKTDVVIERLEKCMGIKN